MAYRSGTANGYLDLLLMLKRLAESTNQISVVTYNPLNTGNGYISAEGATSDSVLEDWTLEFLDAANYTVTGSVSGAQANGTVGVEYTTADGCVVFTVIGGATDWALGDLISFSVTAGLGTQKWTIDEYTASDIDGAPDMQLIMHGPGLAGLDSVYVGIQTLHNVALDYYNWRLQGFVNYTSGIPFNSQPGALPVPLPDPYYHYAPCAVYVFLQNRNMKYWVAINGRRVILFTLVENVYESLYLGLPLPYSFPDERPYPLIVGGCGSDPDGRYSLTGAENNAFFDPMHEWTSTPRAVSLYMRVADQWVDFMNTYNDTSVVDRNVSVSGRGNTFPYSHGVDRATYVYNSYWFGRLRQNIDGSYPIFPIVLWSLPPIKAIWGEFDGLVAIPGVALNAEDTFILNGKSYIILPNTDRRSFMNYAALLME